MPAKPTAEARGIHQSDIIIRTALILAVKDMRQNPWLLDFVFASLPRDTETSHQYGEKEVAQAKKWFLTTEVEKAIFLSANIVEPKFPCISIGLLDTAEAENTLGDVHYEPKQDDPSFWPTLAGPFSPKSYDPGTGTLNLGDPGIVLVEGLQILDRTGTPHPILEVLDRGIVSVGAGVIADFSDCVIKGQKPSQIVTLESATEKETYLIGCHVQNEPAHLTYLHSIVKFCLFRYRQTLLEARGYERSQITSSEFRRNEYFDMENVFSRHIQIVGYVRQVWPKHVVARTESVGFVPVVSPAAGPSLIQMPEIDPNDDDSWLLNMDSVGVKIPQ